MATIKQRIDAVNGDLHHAYTRLMSGKPAGVTDAQSLIATYQTLGVDIAAYDLVRRVKDWIANDKATKKRAFLEKLHHDAMQYYSGGGLGTWRTMAYCAFAFRYSGRFWKAHKAYDVAFRMIGDFDSHTEEDKRQIADVYADYAEFRAYLGHPGEADSILGKFPSGYLKAWHWWARATAYHFWGYEEEQPFGTSGANNDPGSEKRYHESNTFLGIARTMKGKGKALPLNQKVDTYLLEAANWGAICRRRTIENADPEEIHEAKTNAEKALRIFRGVEVDPEIGPWADPMNLVWSWHKERRGRLAIFYRRKLDGVLDRQDVEDWRRKFRNHYRENLKEALLIDKYVPPENQPIDHDLEDGNLDEEDEHEDDEVE